MFVGWNQVKKHKNVISRVNAIFTELDTDKNGLIGSKEIQLLISELRLFIENRLLYLCLSTTIVSIVYSFTGLGTNRSSRLRNSDSKQKHGRKKGIQRKISLDPHCKVKLSKLERALNYLG